MYFKKMIGNKCYLSPLDIGDAEKYVAWLNDREVTIHLTFYSRVISIANEKTFLENLSEDHHYAIIDKSTDESIGTCGFVKIDHLNQTADIGIVIGNKNYWNKGYGSEALTLLLDYGFKALNFHTIGLTVYEFNTRAMASYKKVGFKITGKRREALKRGNETYDILYMDILCNEFYEENNIIKELSFSW
ncbi:MAG: GNAT family N-acetyltransferase [Treponema sp.]|nr:GNAT family N-acetyltransferase [Treponema sp.]